MANLYSLEFLSTSDLETLELALIVLKQQMPDTFDDDASYWRLRNKVLELMGL